MSDPVMLAIGDVVRVRLPSGPCWARVRARGWLDAVAVDVGGVRVWVRPGACWR